jgi:hypothetical protein
MENQYLWGLSNDTIAVVALQKQAIMTDQVDQKYFSADVQPLLHLLKAWFALANKAQTELDEFIQEHLPSSRDGEDFEIPPKTFQELEKLCLAYYVRYLQEAVNFLATAQ